MLPGKPGESLTVRIFLITVLILFGAGAATFGLIALATPTAYTAIVNEQLMEQIDILAAQLKERAPESCGPLIDEFIRTSGADAMVTDAEGQVVDTGSQLSAGVLHPAEEYSEIKAQYETYPDGKPPGGESPAVMAGDTITQPSAFFSWEMNDKDNENVITVTTGNQNILVTDLQFSSQEEVFYLYVTPRIQAENLAVRALIQMAPWLLLVLLAFSLLCALIYSRCITRPILRLNAIAGKMAALDFGWECAERRRDEIGALGRSLDEMARRLSAALTELEAANAALREEAQREREMDRQRMAFFSAASHELKTPVTILKGQLSGMLDGVGIYKDREKYLFRSLQVTGRMEKLIQEMLAITHLEVWTNPAAPLELTSLIEEQLTQFAPLPEQREQKLIPHLISGIIIYGDAALLGRAMENLLSNAPLYSPRGAEIRIWCGRLDGCPALTVENTGTHIREEALPHIFEAFYREENSRNRSTGGSGLGLYLAQMIFSRHGASCTLENTSGGVRATVIFPQDGEKFPALHTKHI